MKQVEIWDKIFKDLKNELPSYDDWLVKFNEQIEKTNHTPIIDLGCGFGNNTRYLTEKGYKVIACDFSIEALKHINRNFPKITTKHFNMLEGLPFPDSFAKVIIADLSIHYFTWEESKKIIKEIFRVLDDGGYFLCRVNSIKEYEHREEKGQVIEENYYDIKGKLKRFFDRRQIEELFYDWDIIHLEEQTLKRYILDKVLWEVAVKK